MRKPTDGQMAIGGLLVFAAWIFIALPLYYGPRDQIPNKCSKEQSENYGFWEKTSCDPVAYFTLWLVGFTGVLGAATIGVLFATNRTAKIAERALTEHERPWLFLEGATVSRRELPGQAPIPNNFFITLKWKNVGRSPAIISSCQFMFEDYTQMTTRPDYSRCMGLITPRTIAVGDDFETNSVGPRSGPENSSEQAMWGRLTYTELNGKIHNTGYCVRISPHIAAFMAWGTDAYDYYD